MSACACRFFFQFSIFMRIEHNCGPPTLHNVCCQPNAQNQFYTKRNIKHETSTANIFNKSTTVWHRRRHCVNFNLILSNSLISNSISSTYLGSIIVFRWALGKLSILLFDWEVTNSSYYHPTINDVPNKRKEQWANSSDTANCRAWYFSIHVAREAVDIMRLCFRTTL